MRASLTCPSARCPSTVEMSSWPVPGQKYQKVKSQKAHRSSRLSNNYFLGPFTKGVYSSKKRSRVLLVALTWGFSNEPASNWNQRITNLSRHKLSSNSEDAAVLDPAFSAGSSPDAAKVKKQKKERSPKISRLTGRPAVQKVTFWTLLHQEFTVLFYISNLQYSSQRRSNVHFKMNHGLLP